MRYVILLIILLIILSIFVLYKKYKESYINDNKPLITFIIPTIGRLTLKRTLDSLKKLNNKNWRAIVIFDGVDSNVIEEDDRIKIIKHEKKIGDGYNGAGNVRNYSYQFVETPWVGFVDDHDTLNEYYIDHLEKEIERKNIDNIDVLIFRMIYENGQVLPKPGDIDFKKEEVGISFCLKTSLAKEFLFTPNQFEDFNLLNKLRENKKKIRMSEYIAYNVRV